MGEQYRDNTYGSIDLNPLQSALYHSGALENSRNISQLGLVKYLYPQAENTRLVHNMGACILAGLYARALELGRLEAYTLEAAAGLHDVGHPPFSHAAAQYFKEKWGFTQEELARAKILRDGEINTLLVEHGLSPEKVAELIFDKGFCKKYHGRQRYLKQLVAGTMDVDRIDFLQRDAQGTAPYGAAVDYSRLLQCARRTDHAELGDIVYYDEDGLAAIQMFFATYAAMYKAVYYNPNVKAWEAFLNKALFLAHDYIWEHFKEFKDDPSQIREKDIVEALAGIPTGNKQHLIAREISEIIFGKRKIPDVAFLRNTYPDDLEKLKKIYAAHPYDGKGQDPLEQHLIAAVPDAKEGEILVLRNRLTVEDVPNGKPSDVFIKLRHSGLSESGIIPVDHIINLESFRKELKHRHALRVLTIREVYREPLLDALKKIVRE